AEYVGEVLVASQVQAGSDNPHGGINTQATLILGGQIAGERPGLYLVYPLGNCISTSPETPYLQIGESKYGKPILDRIVRPGTAHARRTRRRRAPGARRRPPARRPPPPRAAPPPPARRRDPQPPPARARRRPARPGPGSARRPPPAAPARRCRSSLPSSSGCR